MPKVFADTAGWANFFVQTEKFHNHAIQLMHKWHQNQTEVVTTNYVLGELVALFSSPLRIPRQRQIESINTIKTASWVTIVYIDQALDTAAWQLLTQRPDKNWSLVDCASMVVADMNHIDQIFTSDHHFTQAGFTKLLG